MRVHVLHFGPLRDARGLSEEAVEVPEGTTAAGLLDLLHPGRGGLPVVFAVDHTRAPGDTVLTDGGFVAFLPPVGGG